MGAMASQTTRTTDVAALAFDYGDRLIVGTTRDVHRAIAKRVFGATRLLGSRVPEAVHDSVSGRVYDTISGALRLSSNAARGLSARGIGAPVDRSPVGRGVRAAVNGLIGDELRMLDDPHAISMSLRVDGQDVELSRWRLSEAFRPAGDHVVVFVHGLCESDDSWNSSRTKRGSTYPERVAAETGATPVVVRYNTGLHVSENGQHLDLLMRQLVELWPTTVRRVTLVGHSMGGLVIRAATNHATANSQTWQHLVSDVVCLGTPHAGARLEKVAHLGSQLLKFFPESRPFSTVLDSRSSGILDLRHGYISADDWRGQDLTARWGLDRIAVAPLPRAEYHFVAATVGASAKHPLSAVLGDLLVHFSSAAGIGPRGPVVDGTSFEYIPSTHHFALLNHPQVADWLVRWVNHERPIVAALDPAPQR